jgi:hypothetical protein
MKTKWLFDRSVKKWGWIVFLPSLILGVAHLHFDFILDSLAILNDASISDSENFTDEVAAIGVIVGLFLIGFSKVKEEDEMIFAIRSNALQVGMYINYLMILISIILIYDHFFFTVMIYNMFTPLLVYNVVFYLKLQKMRRTD